MGRFHVYFGYWAQDEDAETGTWLGEKVDVGRVGPPSQSAISFIPLGASLLPRSYDACGYCTALDMFSLAFMKSQIMERKRVHL